MVVGVDEEAVVVGAGDELGVGAAVGDLAVGEEDDLVGQGDRGLAVGDHDDRRSVGVGGVGREGGEDALLDLGVDGAGGVVHDEQSRPAHQRTRQGEPLPLAAGQRGATLAELRVEALRQRRDESLGLDRAQRRPDVGVRRRLAERDVLAYRVVEQERRLRHDGHGIGERGVGELAYVDAVDAHRARVGVDEPGEELRERALAGTGGADDGDHASGREVEIDPAQHLGPVFVREAHVTKRQAGRSVVRQAAMSVCHLT